MADQVGSWARIAGRDLRVAKLTLAEDLFDAAVFNAHQTAENGLKALWLSRTSTLPPRTHNLPELATGLQAPPTIEANCRALNPHYTASRYPDAANGDPAENYDRASGARFVEMAEEVYLWCLSQLPS